MGYQAVEDSTTADYATGFGAYTLRDLTTGNNNTAVGAFAGDDITTGANNTCIGYQATASSGTVNNEITLGKAVSLASYSWFANLERLMEMSLLTIQVVETSLLFLEAVVVHLRSMICQTQLLSTVEQVLV